MRVETDPELLHLLRNGDGTQKGAQARDFILALATCNTIVPIVVDTSDPAQKLIDYQGESPDEQALVYAAAAYGFMLIERTSGHIIIDVFGQRQRYTNFIFLLYLYFFNYIYHDFSKLVVSCGVVWHIFALCPLVLVDFVVIASFVGASVCLFTNYSGFGESCKIKR